MENVICEILMFIAFCDRFCGLKIFKSSKLIWSAGPLFGLGHASLNGQSTHKSRYCACTWNLRKLPLLWSMHCMMVAFDGIVVRWLTSGADWFSRPSTFATNHVLVVSEFCQTSRQLRWNRFSQLLGTVGKSIYIPFIFRLDCKKIFFFETAKLLTQTKCSISANKFCDFHSCLSKIAYGNENLYWWWLVPQI